MRAPATRDLSFDLAGGLRLGVRVTESGCLGEAPAALLLHGFTGSADSWTRLTAVIAPAVDVIAPDLPGHGRSSVPADPARYAFEWLADDLRAVLEMLGIERVGVLGYSMGGRAALKFALRHPTMVSALVLESTSPGLADAEAREARRRSDEELATLAERDGIEAFVDRWERLPLWASQATLDDWSRGELRAQRLAQSPGGVANTLRGSGQGVDAFVGERLGELAMPVLLIAGALDNAYVAATREMARRIPRAHVEIVPDAGHAVHLERPREYAAIVKSFLAAHSFPPRAAAQRFATDQEP